MILLCNFPHPSKKKGVVDVGNLEEAQVAVSRCWSLPETVKKVKASRAGQFPLY